MTKGKEERKRRLNPLIKMKAIEILEPVAPVVVANVPLVLLQNPHRTLRCDKIVAPQLPPIESVATTTHLGSAYWDALHRSCQEAAENFTDLHKLK